MIMQPITVRTSKTFCSKEFYTSHKTGSAFTQSCLAKNRSVLRCCNRHFIILLSVVRHSVTTKLSIGQSVPWI